MKSNKLNDLHRDIRLRRDSRGARANRRGLLLRGVSGCAFALVAGNIALAQQSLPTIDIGGSRGRPGTPQNTGPTPRSANTAGALPAPSLPAPRSTELGGRLTGYNAVGPVSSSKTNIPILQTPYSVQIVPRETMDDRQAISVRDALSTNVSGISGAAGYYDGIKIRGFDSGGQLYRNGLKQQETSNLETTNLQSIEVLKGPAAMLFGRVEPGGLINFVPKRPQETPYFSVHQQAGTFRTTRTSIDATGPLTADKTLLYRFNASYLDKRSFQPFVGQDNLLIAPTITWRPTDRFTLNIDGEYHRVHFTDPSPIPAVGFRPATIPISTYLLDSAIATNYPNFQERALFAYDWTFEFEPGWSVTNRFSYTNVDYRQRGPGPYFLEEATGELSRYIWFSPLPNVADPFYYRRAIATNVDLKGKVQTGPFTHNILAGFDYYNAETKSNGSHCCDDLPTINIYAPIQRTINVDLLSNNYRAIIKDKWTGLYLQDQISFWDDRIHVLLGGRHDWAESSDAFGFNGETLGEIDKQRAVVTTSANSPRAGLLIQPFPWLSIYGNYTRSYGPSNGASPLVGSLPPQIGTQYEGGVKAELLDGNLTATFAYFDITKKNLTRPVPGTPFVRPIGEARSNGVEFDLTGRINENWSIIANFTHLDARITKDEDDAGTGGNTGKRLASVPHNLVNLWAKYEASGDFRGLSLGGGVHYVDKQFGDDANSYELPAYARLDAMAAYRFKAPQLPLAPNLTFQVNVTNLLGTTYYEGTGGDRFFIWPGAPRAFLASVRAEF